jgi:hypothetical protein
MTPHEARELRTSVRKVRRLIECYRETLRRERDAALVEVERLKGELELMRGTTYCAYCSERFELDSPDMTERVTAHILTCPKHPMRAVEAERDALQAELREAIKHGAWLQGELTEAKGQLVALKYGNTKEHEQ